MLCYYKTLSTNMYFNIFICCVYRAAADTVVNDFTWTHCASCLFNTWWFIFMLLLIGLTFLTHPPNKRKRISNPVAHRCTPFPGNMSFNPETVAKRWAPVWAWTWPRSSSRSRDWKLWIGGLLKPINPNGICPKTQHRKPFLNGFNG